MHYLEYNTQVLSTYKLRKSVNTLHFPLPSAKSYRWSSLTTWMSWCRWCRLNCFDGNSLRVSCSGIMGVTESELSDLLFSWRQAFSWSVCFLTTFILQNDQERYRSSSLFNRSVYPFRTFPSVVYQNRICGLETSWFGMFLVIMNSASTRM